MSIDAKDFIFRFVVTAPTTKLHFVTSCASSLLYRVVQRRRNITHESRLCVPRSRHPVVFACDSTKPRNAPALSAHVLPASKLSTLLAPFQEFELVGSNFHCFIIDIETPLACALVHKAAVGVCPLRTAAFSLHITNSHLTRSTRAHLRPQQRARPPEPQLMMPLRTLLAASSCVHRS